MLKKLANATKETTAENRLDDNSSICSISWTFPTNYFIKVGFTDNNVHYFTAVDIMKSSL